MVKRLDDALGRLMDALESTGQADNTIVVFISDHGCHFKTRNAEHKRSPHESSVRIPFALWGPSWNGGGEHSCPASLVDLAPSLLDSAGIAIPTAMQGVSLLPVATGKKDHLPEESFIQFGDGGMCPGRALRTSRWKYAITATEAFRNQPDATEYVETALYDLQTYPYEPANLVDQKTHEPIRAAFRERIRQRMTAIGEPDCTISPVVPYEGFTQRTIDYPNP